MYLTFYGLKERPFSLLPDPLYLYLSDKHQMAATLLEYAITSQAGFAVITGEIGAGKTTLIRHLLNRLDRRITVGLISNTHASLGGLLRWVLLAFELEGKDEDPARMYERFVEFLIAQYAKGRRTVLIVDEAQNLPASILEELRMLSNINADKDQVLQTILVGQPGLRETLRRPDLTQFAQRIVVDYHLEPLTPEETCACIRHRLGVAGGRPDQFSDEACAAVYRYSGGSPRLINLICDMSLVYGFAAQAAVITDELVDEVVRDRQRLGALPIFVAPPTEAPAKSRKLPAASVPAAPPPTAKSPETAPVRKAESHSEKMTSAAPAAAMPPPAPRPSVDTKPVDTKPVDTKPVDTKPVDTKPVDTKPVDTKPVDTKPVDTKPVDTKPVDTKPVPASKVVVLAERVATATGSVTRSWLSPGVAFAAGVALTLAGAVLFLVDRIPLAPPAPPLPAASVPGVPTVSQSEADAQAAALSEERAHNAARARELEARLAVTRSEAERLRAQAAEAASKAEAERLRAEAALVATRAEAERLRAEAEAAAARAEAERRRVEEAAAKVPPPAPKATAEAGKPSAGEPAKAAGGDTEFLSNPCKGPMAQFLSLCAQQQ